MDIEIQQKNNQNIDLQKSLNSQGNQLNTEIRYLKESCDKQLFELKQRESKI
jgi:competence transcription factor ComK